MPKKVGIKQAKAGGAPGTAQHSMWYRLFYVASLTACTAVILLGCAQIYHYLRPYTYFCGEQRTVPADPTSAVVQLTFVLIELVLVAVFVSKKDGKKAWAAQWGVLAAFAILAVIQLYFAVANSFQTYCF